MIGGMDIRVRVKLLPILAAFAEVWPNLTMEIELPNEMFVYRDATARKSWDILGATEATEDSMVHILVGPVFNTLVVCPEAGSVTRTVAEELAIRTEPKLSAAERAYRSAMREEWGLPPEEDVDADAG